MKSKFICLENFDKNNVFKWILNSYLVDNNELLVEVAAAVVVDCFATFYLRLFYEIILKN
jgi:hypothetical protein